MKRDRPADTRGSLGLAIGVVMFTVALMAYGGWQVLRTVAHTPQMKLTLYSTKLRADHEREGNNTAALAQQDPVLGTLIELEQKSIVGGDTALLDAWTTWLVSRAFVQLLHAPTESVDEAGFATQAGRVSTNQLARLQLAVSRVLAADRTGLDAAQVWGRITPLLEGLNSGNFQHNSRALLDRLAASYEPIRLGAGSSLELARVRYGIPHYTFLQYAAAMLERLAAGADDAKAALCRAVLHRLLRQWIVEPGPVTLRLLAADLLARQLELESEAPELVAELRAFRQRYRDAFTARPQAVIGLRSGAVLCPEHDQYISALGSVGWTTSAMTMTGLLAFSLIFVAVRATALGVYDWRPPIIGLAAAMVIALAGAVFANLFREVIRTDFHSDFSQPRYYWRHPFVAAASAALVLLLASRLLPPAPGFRRVAVAAWWTTCGLAIAIPVVAGMAESARARYETAQGAALHDEYAALVGQSAESQLTKLRAWRP